MNNEIKRGYFLQTERIGFSIWHESDTENALLLWGNTKVTRYICASGVFSPDEIEARLQREIEEHKQSGVQYWPIFQLNDGNLVVQKVRRCS